MSIYQLTQFYISKDLNLYEHRHENFKYVLLKALFTLWSTALSGSWIRTFGVTHCPVLRDENDASFSMHRAVSL
jgi:hypothetical protein